MRKVGEDVDLLCIRGLEIEIREADDAHHARVGWQCTDAPLREEPTAVVLIRTPQSAARDEVPSLHAKRAPKSSAPSGPVHAAPRIMPAARRPISSLVITPQAFPPRAIPTRSSI